MSTPSLPPRLFRSLVRACLAHGDDEYLLRDLDVLYAYRVVTRGKASATTWYAKQTFEFVVRVGVLRIADTIGDFDSLRSDVRHALRSLRRRPAFAFAFILTLAVGTGVLASVYSAARWVLLRPVPGVGAPNDLVTLRLGSAQAPPFVTWDVSHADLLVLRERLPVHGALAGATAIDVDLRPDAGEPLRAAGEMVTANYFSVLQASLTAGRSFLPEDDSPLAGSPSVVLSAKLARSLNPDDPARLVGGDVRMNGVLVKVVGVAGAGFQGSELPGKAEFWVPLAATAIVDPSVDPTAATQRNYGAWRRMVARTVPGVTPASLESAANAVIQTSRTEFQLHSYPALHMRYQVNPGIGLDPGVQDSVKRTLALLSGAALLLLLLAIANLMNLALVQSTLRRATTAIRFALGASRAQIARMLLVETLLLGAAGALLALPLATAWNRWFQDSHLNERGAPLAGMHIDLTVAAVIMGTALVAALIAHVTPARLIRVQMLDHLMRRGAESAPAPQRVRATLVAFQVALSIVLLVTAALLGRTVANLRHLDLGFQPDRLLTYSLDPHLHGHESVDLDRLARGVETRLMQDPAVTGAGFISPSPLGSGYFTASLYPSDAPDVKPIIAAGYFVTPGFLPTLGLTTIAGDRHWAADSGTAVISRAMLEKLFPGAAPMAVIDRVLPTRSQGRNPVRIAAVIEDVKLSDVTGRTTGVILRPMSERRAGASLMGIVSTPRPPARLTALVSRTLHGEAPDLPLFSVRTARQAVDLQFAERDAMARAASTLSVIGLLLAAIGLYGVLSNIVAARRREIGIRSALGATPGQIIRMVARAGLIPVACGAFVGVAAAAGFSKLLSAYLYDLGRFDPLSYAMSVAALVTASMVACWLPAYRATSVSPVDALREE